MFVRTAPEADRVPERRPVHDRFIVRVGITGQHEPCPGPCHAGVQRVVIWRQRMAGKLLWHVVVAEENVRFDAVDGAPGEHVVNDIVCTKKRNTGVDSSAM